MELHTVDGERLPAVHRAGPGGTGGGVAVVLGHGVGDVAPLPLVHGDFMMEHPRALLAAAGVPVELWIEPGLGYAGKAAGPQLLDRLARRLPELVRC